MAKVPSDIVEGIKKLSEASGVPIKSLVERLKQIKDTNENIKTMEEEDFKIRFAWAILLKETTSSGSEYYVTPICNPSVREITSKGEKTKVGDLVALIQKITKNEDDSVSLGKVQYAAGTLWRDAAANLETVEAGKVYKASLLPKDNSWGVSVTSNNTSFLPASFKMKSFKEFFDEELKEQAQIISIEEMDISKSETTTDVRMIKATVTESDTRERPDGSLYGYYDITDESVIGTKNQRVFVNPKDVLYEQGSVVLFGGLIDIDDEGKVRWSHHFQIPTKSVMKKEIKIKSPTKQVDDSIDLENMEMDSVEKETKTEEKETKTEEKTKDIDDGDDLNFEV